MHFILIALAGLLALGTASPWLPGPHGAGTAAGHSGAAHVSAPAPPPASMDGVIGGGPS